MKNSAPMITTLGLIEGEILTYLDQNGKTTLTEITRRLEWPPQYLWMALGSLVRSGLVRIGKHEQEILIEPNDKSSLATDGSPEVWGG